MIHTIWHAIVRIAGAVFAEREFDCGDCLRSHQCGRPPDKNCAFRLMQIARSDRMRTQQQPWGY